MPLGCVGNRAWQVERRNSSVEKMLQETTNSIIMIIMWCLSASSVVSPCCCCCFLLPAACRIPRFRHQHQQHSTNHPPPQRLLPPPQHRWPRAVAAVLRWAPLLHTDCSPQQPALHRRRRPQALELGIFLRAELELVKQLSEPLPCTQRKHSFSAGLFQMSSGC